MLKTNDEPSASRAQISKNATSRIRNTQALSCAIQTMIGWGRLAEGDVAAIVMRSLNQL